MEDSEDNDDEYAKDQESSDPMRHEVTHGSHGKNDKAGDNNSKVQSNGENTFKTTIVTPLTCTYHRGKRDVFAASKRQRAISSQAIKPLDKGKEKMKRSEQQIKVRRSKRIKKTSQEPQFIDLDSDNEDKEMATRLLLLTKDAQLKEWERDFEMAQQVIQYYKNEHKHFKKVKRDLAL